MYVLAFIYCGLKSVVAVIVTQTNVILNTTSKEVFEIIGLEVGVFFVCHILWDEVF